MVGGGGGVSGRGEGALEGRRSRLMCVVCRMHGDRRVDIMVLFVLAPGVESIRPRGIETSAEGAPGGGAFVVRCA